MYKIILLFKIYISPKIKHPRHRHIPGGGGIKLQENKEKEINEKLIFLNADASNIPLSDNTADTIITTQFLYAVPNPEAIIEEISRLIKNDGYLIITVPHSTPLMTDPYDYLRFTPNYFQNYIAQKYCYDVIKIDKSGDIFNSFALSLSMELVLSKYDGRHPMKLIPWRRIVFSPLIFFINALAFFLEHIFIFTRHPGNLAIIMRKK
jgi:SAM-dependent methyltransferase